MSLLGQIQLYVGALLGVRFCTEFHDKGPPFLFCLSFPLLTPSLSVLSGLFLQQKFLKAFTGGCCLDMNI